MKILPKIILFYYINCNGINNSLTIPATSDQTNSINQDIKNMDSNYKDPSRIRGNDRDKKNKEGTNSIENQDISIINNSTYLDPRNSTMNKVGSKNSNSSRSMTTLFLSGPVSSSKSKYSNIGASLVAVILKSLF